MAANPNHYDIIEYERKLIRRFNGSCTQSDVADMTLKEAKYICENYATESICPVARYQALLIAQQAIGYMDTLYGRNQNTPLIENKE